MPWFTSRGHVVQTVAAIAALSFAAHSAWKDMKSSDYFSGGAILFYLLVAIVLISLWRVTVIIKNHIALLRSKGDRATDKPALATPEFWKWIGRVIQMAIDAEILKKDLERLEYDWQKSGTMLVLPLADSSMPSPGEPLSWNQRELLGFRFMYRDHLERIPRIVSEDFKSPLTLAGFPCSLDTYRAKQVLEMHASDLRDYADSWIKRQTTTEAP